MIKRCTLICIIFCLLTGLATTVQAQMSKELVKKETPVPIENMEGEPEMLSYKDQLIALIDKDEIFLRPDISSEEIARLLRTNTSVLEEIMQSGFGQDYKHFINSRRVKTAAETLSHPDLVSGYYESKEEKEAILADIAIKCGYKSKGVLLKMFKKYHGISISNYMEQEIESEE